MPIGTARPPVARVAVVGDVDAGVAGVDADEGVRTVGVDAVPRRAARPGS